MIDNPSGEELMEWLRSLKDVQLQVVGEMCANVLALRALESIEREKEQLKREAEIDRRRNSRGRDTEFTLADKALLASMKVKL